MADREDCLLERIAAKGGAIPVEDEDGEGEDDAPPEQGVCGGVRGSVG